MIIGGGYATAATQIQPKLNQPNSLQIGGDQPSSTHPKIQSPLFNSSKTPGGQSIGLYGASDAAMAAYRSNVAGDSSGA